MVRPTIFITVLKNMRRNIQLAFLIRAPTNIEVLPMNHIIYAVIIGGLAAQMLIVAEPMTLIRVPTNSNQKRFRFDFQSSDQWSRTFWNRFIDG
jgi:hypothetical protein